MLINPLKEKLKALSLTGFLEGMEDQERTPGAAADLSFEDRLGLLVDREITVQENRRTERRLKAARLRQNATPEDLDFRSPRNLPKPLVQTLLSGQWIANHQNILVTGPTGVGKSYLGEALGHKACRMGYRVLLIRFPRLFQSLDIARHTGKYPGFLKNLARQDVIIIEDFLLSPMTSEHRQDLFEILEDRYNVRATLVTSQIPLPEWHNRIGDPTLADAILDRLVHGAYTIEMKGEVRHEVAQVIVPLCLTTKEGTHCSVSGSLPRHASGAIRWYEALGTTYPAKASPSRETTSGLPAERRSGGQAERYGQRK